MRLLAFISFTLVLVSIPKSFAAALECPVSLRFYMGLRLNADIILSDKTELLKRKVYSIDGELELKATDSRHCSYTLSYEINWSHSKEPLTQGRTRLSIIAKNGDWDQIATEILGLNFKALYEGWDEDAAVFRGDPLLKDEDLGSVKIELTPDQSRPLKR